MTKQNITLQSENKMATSKHITPYEDLAIENANRNALKQLACAILLSAVEDADVEFLTDDYEEWKYYREKRKKKSDFFTEIDYQIGFKKKQEYKEVLFDICEITVRSSDIPNEVLEERRVYERNKMKNLMKLTGFKKETLMNVAKLHGWKIGIDYVEPSMFDDNF